MESLARLLIDGQTRRGDEESTVRTAFMARRADNDKVKLLMKRSRVSRVRDEKGGVLSKMTKRPKRRRKNAPEAVEREHS